MLIQIKNRWSGAVLFECDVPADVPSGLAMRHALEKAVAVRPRADLSDAYLSGADLSGADLSDAVLRGANLSGADLSGAVLRGAYLSDAYLSGADLSGAYLSDADGNPLPRATSEQAIENLDKVRAIILDDKARLEMGHWHQNSDWRERTCAEETLCGTTHCLAGWLQVCTTEPALKGIDAELAGILAAPVASKMFFRGQDEVLNWLEKREYATGA